MELCYMTLEEYLMERNYNGDDILMEDEINIFKQLINGLEYIHSQNIIHGDLNPKNIFLTENLEVKIGDFGLSKKHKKHNEIVNTTSYGNSFYMPPEHIEQHICSEKTDIYSLGIILFELLYQFSTKMERVVLIEKIKNGYFNDVMIDENDKLMGLTENQINIIKMMIEKDYEKRTTIDYIKNNINNINK